MDVFWIVVWGVRTYTAYLLVREYIIMSPHCWPNMPCPASVITRALHQGGWINLFLLLKKNVHPSKVLFHPYSIFHFNYLQVNQTKYFNVHNEIYLLESTSIVMQKKGSKCLRFLLCTTLERGKPEACAKPLLWSWLDINLIDSTNESFKKNAHRPVQIDPLLKQHYCSLEPRRSRARNIDEDSIRKKYVQPSINVSVNATTSHQLSMKGVSKAGR